MKNRTHLLLLGILIALGITMRFLPHPANATPIAALALFAGVYCSRRSALFVPLAAMVVSDYFLGFHDVIAFTWGSFAIIGVLGWWVRKKKSLNRVLTATVGGSVLFYLVTNWAVWALTELYPKTLDGLLLSYSMGLPFFRNMALGDLFYVGVFFGAYELVAVALRRRVPVTSSL